MATYLVCHELYQSLVRPMNVDAAFYAMHNCDDL